MGTFIKELETLLFFALFEAFFTYNNFSSYGQGSLKNLIPKKNMRLCPMQDMGKKSFILEQK